MAEFAPNTWLTSGELGLFVLSFVGTHLRIKRVWVECKHWEKGVQLAHVLDLKWKVDDVRKHAPHLTDWKPTHVFMVSGTDYDPLALRVAHSYGIECYREVPTPDGEPAFVQTVPPPVVE